MPETLALKGSCLCGEVKITASKAKAEFEACHCEMCAKWGGGPFLTVECGHDIDIEGAESVSVFASSEWAERAFCKHCGTHLYYHLKGHNGYTLSLGLFDERPQLPFERQIFIDSKPADYHFGTQTKTLTGKETFALYGA